MAKSEGSSSSARSSYKKKVDGPLCYCNKRSTPAKAWTDDNPGRRFWCCGSHGFVDWIDKQEQNEWQKQSLLEARGVMDRQREEIKKRDRVRTYIILRYEKKEWCLLFRFFVMLVYDINSMLARYPGEVPSITSTMLFWKTYHIATIPLSDFI